jgi:2-amino-4-hydroxy-6-hydroxymethyldihydropteridine diphosphokinase
MRRTREQLHELRRPVVRAFLALGFNVGDRRATLVSALRNLPEAVRWSGCYETEPIGGPGGQTPHLNAIVELATRLDPYALLAVCKRLERNAGRVRTVRNGPRTLDVDIVLYGDTVLDSPELTIPHPRMNERRFVLQPLSDLAPELCPSGWDAKLPPAAVERVADLVLED